MASQTRFAVRSGPEPRPRAEAIEARQNAEREEARRARMRENMHARVQIASHYADAFRSFGSSRQRPPTMNRLQRIAPAVQPAGETLTQRP